MKILQENVTYRKILLACAMKAWCSRNLAPPILNLSTTWALIVRWGKRWRSWLRYCATSRKVAGSIPDGVIGIFH
jgi:hypothetical protein